MKKGEFTLLLMWSLAIIVGCKSAAVTINGGYTSVSVKAFGAVGDGTTNDTKAFQQGIEALRRGEIAELILPKGNFLIDILKVRVCNLIDNRYAVF
jgi:polygalacturonase